jgi:hypothetical protein
LLKVKFHSDMLIAHPSPHARSNKTLHLKN